MSSLIGTQEGKKAQILTAILTVVGVVLFDQISKWWICRNFNPFEQYTVIPGFLNLVRVNNTGVAFGLGAGQISPLRQVFFTVVSILVMVILCYYFWQGHKDAIFSLAVAGIFGGAVGNLIDRLRWGSVVDFLDFYIGNYHWPAFNVADTAICVGAGLLVWGNMRSVKGKKG